MVPILPSDLPVRYSVLMEDVLVLNVDFTPYQAVSWRHAIEKLLAGKVRLVQTYADRFIRSATQVFEYPAVVVLTGRYRRRRVKLNRKNLISRDAFTCQYCGAQPKKSNGRPQISELTLDHVVPRSHARDGIVVLPWSGEKVPATSWSNLLTACESCNGFKSNRTPEQAQMKMRKIPAPPSADELAWMSIAQRKIPDEWKFYLGDDSPWSDYWDVELESD